jgi:hypothetical protein
MKLVEVKKVKIGEKSFPIKLTNRAMIEYESLTGDTVLNLAGSERLVKLFYCTAKAGAKSEGHDFKYGYEEFLDLIDDYYLDVLNNFTEAIAGMFSKTEAPEGKKE